MVYNNFGDSSLNSKSTLKQIRYLDGVISSLIIRPLFEALVVVRTHKTNDTFKKMMVMTHDIKGLNVPFWYKDLKRLADLIKMA